MLIVLFSFENTLNFCFQTLNETNIIKYQKLFNTNSKMNLLNELTLYL